MLICTWLKHRHAVSAAVIQPYAKSRGTRLREKGQPYNAGRVGSRVPLPVRDGIELGTVRLEHSLGGFLTSHEQPDQRSYPAGLSSGRPRR